MISRTSLHEWIRAWDSPNETTAIITIYEKLKCRYTEPHRYYHNLRHIDACLEEYSEVQDILQDPFELWLAIWFHDVVYDPRGKDNEELSAQYAEATLQGTLERDTQSLVSQLILATKHDKLASSNSERFIVDIDLAILGKDRTIFTEYEMNIRREYEWVPEDMFRRGRANILKGFLARDSIYQTEHFYEKYEDSARDNIRHSISALTKEK